MTRVGNLLETLRGREAPAEGVAPHFQGLGIGNVARSLLEALDVDAGGALPALAPDLLPPEQVEDVARVLLLVVDGLGWHALRDHVTMGGSGFLSRITREGVAGPMTSVLPSTTATALPTLYTGLAPATHGWTAPWAWWPERDEVVNLLRFRTASTGQDLTEQGVDPRDLLPHPTLGARAVDAGVGCRVVTRDEHVGSPLTEALHGDADVVGYRDLPELAAATREALDEAGGPGLVIAYWDGVDVVGHAQGPRSDAFREAIGFLDAGLMEGLGNVLEDPGTLVVATADHGMVPTPPPLHVNLSHHGELLAALRAPPTGDGRVRFLHVEAGREEEVRGYVEDRFPHGAAVRTQEELLARGIYGPDAAAEGVRGRYGDLALMARGGRTLGVRYGEHGPSRLKGHHGGLGEEEMLVPLLGHRA